MGDKSAKRTNKLLDQQTNSFNQFSNQMGGYGAEDRAYGTGSRSRIDDAYWDLYNDVGSGEGGGGGFTPQYADPRENEAQALYRDWAKTGGISPEEESIFRARATSSLPGFFEGIRTKLGQTPTAGYSGQIAKLGRDEGRALQDASLGAEAGVLDRRLQGKQWGTTGLERTDEGLIGRQMQVERERNAAAAAGARSRQGGIDDAFRNRMGILSELRGLRGESGSDLPYFDRQLAGLGGGANTIRSRVAEPDFASRALGAAGSLAGMAAPFVGGFGGPRRPTSAGQPTGKG